MKVVGWGFITLIALAIIGNMISSNDEQPEVARVATSSETVNFESKNTPLEPTTTEEPTSSVKEQQAAELVPTFTQAIKVSSTNTSVAINAPVPLSTFTSKSTPISDPCTVEVKQEGRNEPEYVGLQGYIIESYPDYYSDALPSYPWGVSLLEQVGPDLWEKGTQILPHKTPVVVLLQFLTHEGFGRYSGFLVIKSLEDSKEYRVDHHNFTPIDYWNCPVHQAIKYSSFVARVKGDVRPVNRDGQWEEMGEQKEVFCNGTPGIESDRWVENGVECLMYKQYKYGFEGVVHIFPANSLEIVY
jgi:hypothetical protein